MIRKFFYEGDRNKPGPSSKTTRMEEIVITLTRLRLGLPVSVISNMFGVSTTVVGQIFITWIKILSQVTKPLRAW